MDVDQINEISKFPMCNEHSLPLMYFCKGHADPSKTSACGDCLLDHHADHIKTIVRVKTLVNSANANYQKVQSMSKQDGEENERAELLKKDLAKLMGV